MEIDEEKARAEIKTVLKTFLIELELIYDEKFITKYLGPTRFLSSICITDMNQNTLADTDFYEPETPIQMMENLIMAEDVKVLAKMDKIEVIEDSELTGIEESEPMEELELMGMKESELIGVEESLKTEDEIDKWYKFVL
ncbi:hypothetical protein RhiirA1_469089 [Rhizophagus irregularis]|uniref:Uncharacterized protein n=1 Tax=Rhizophagus irregularis TaxID=588596 RepID=A0A2N0R8S5_9GLOM|nr:hypothetical protein RhiirA1_469089 [Rhizophagus irregularis]